MKNNVTILTDNVRGKLMMVCGCLHDIAEKSKEHYTPKQIAQVQKQIEKILRYREASCTTNKKNNKHDNKKLFSWKDFNNEVI